MSFSGRKKCHYETLGVGKDATMEEIKAAFRKLSLETHPDVAGANACPEKFKLISNAASVLTNVKLKRVYDESQRSLYSSSLSNHFTGSHNFHRHGHDHHKGNSSFNATTPWIVHLFRPRNLILGPIVLYVGVSTMQYMFGVETNPIEANKKLFSHDDKAAMVQAWLNPQSGRYETPAPWDPIYQQLQPELQYVPRNQVQSRTR
jgi:curved DNA-binding protein CbpA